MNKARQQAIIDMKAEGISITFLHEERAILEFTATENSIRVDFRRFNRPTENFKRNK